ncbi:uroporphyrinogen-III synthase [Candidatus Pantoea edessiphila]|uniref:Uroporphyrinogen-III synthase n=1 Tax=Candidatus Pantoea edessiphila TaxID=2044610 RepID=A0A2P5SZC0_9GAMM|nr:uroporphyrinogen-III synthase [Candidatus Pantoea edessiphila]PPI87666.1 uroporphyrinogen-III synthase [Candidatus Pantoea edessiphila]
MTILITRPEPANKDLILRLETSGKKAYSLPLIEFIPGKDLAILPYFLTNMLYSRDLVFILSQQAVYFAQSALQRIDMLWPINLNYYAIGYKTALSFKKVSKLNINYPIVQETSEELIKLLILQNVHNNKRAVICSGYPSRGFLKQELSNLDIKVFFIECYKSIKKKYDGFAEGKRLRKLGINTLVVTSSNMLKQLFYLFPEIDREEWLLKCKLLVFSERILNMAKTLGWKEIYVTEKCNNEHILKILS